MKWYDFFLQSRYLFKSPDLSLPLPVEDHLAKTCFLYHNDPPELLNAIITTTGFWFSKYCNLLQPAIQE